MKTRKYQYAACPGCGLVHRFDHSLPNGLRDCMAVNCPKRFVPSKNATTREAWLSGAKNQGPQIDTQIEILKPRQIVRQFALDMELILRKNDDKGGWDNEAWEDLMKRLCEERGEASRALKKFYNVLNNPGDKTFSDRIHLGRQAADELVDVANFAMMIYDLVYVKIKDLEHSQNAAPPPAVALHDRVDALETKLDRILERLGIVL